MSGKPYDRYLTAAVAESEFAVGVVLRMVVMSCYETRVRSVNIGV